MKTLIAIALFSLAGCSMLPGSPSCDEVNYQRKGHDFEFYCKGQAGMLGGPL